MGEVERWGVKNPSCPKVQSQLAPPGLARRIAVSLDVNEAIVLCDCNGTSIAVRNCMATLVRIRSGRRFPCDDRLAGVHRLTAAECAHQGMNRLNSSF